MGPCPCHGPGERKIGVLLSKKMSTAAVGKRVSSPHSSLGSEGLYTDHARPVCHVERANERAAVASLCQRREQIQSPSWTRSSTPVDFYLQPALLFPIPFRISSFSSPFRLPVITPSRLLFTLWVSLKRNSLCFSGSIWEFLPRVVFSLAIGILTTNFPR